VYDYNATGSNFQSVPCYVNPNLKPPLCISVNFTYTSGNNASVRISGSDVRFYRNGVRQATTCTIFDSEAGSAAETAYLDPPPLTPNSTILEQVDAYVGGRFDSSVAYGPRPQPRPYNFTEIVERVTAHVLRDQTYSSPVYMAAMKRAAMQFRKDTIECEAANTIRYALRAYIAFAQELVLTVPTLYSTSPSC
jgi:hypothetical protein